MIQYISKLSLLLIALISKNNVLSEIFESSYSAKRFLRSNTGILITDVVELKSLENKGWGEEVFDDDDIELECAYFNDNTQKLETCSFEEVSELSENIEIAKQTYQNYRWKCIVDECNAQGTQFCKNTWNQRLCVCHKGWKHGENDEICSEDIDECELSIHNCNGEHEICINSAPSYDYKPESGEWTVRQGTANFTCECENGFKRSDNGSCTNIDFCADLNIDCGYGSCKNFGGSFTCACDQDYEVDSEDRCTIPIIQIETTQKLVTLNMTSVTPKITPKPGENMPTFSPEITQEMLPDECENGFKRNNNGFCTPVDFCADLNIDCGYGICQNIIGSFTCTCDQGYEVDFENRCTIRIIQNETTQKLVTVDTTRKTETTQKFVTLNTTTVSVKTTKISDIPDTPGNTLKIFPDAASEDEKDKFNQYDKGSESSLDYKEVYDIFFNESGYPAYDEIDLAMISDDFDILSMINTNSDLCDTQSSDFGNIFANTELATQYDLLDSQTFTQNDNNDIADLLTNSFHNAMKNSALKIIGRALSYVRPHISHALAISQNVQFFKIDDDKLNKKIKKIDDLNILKLSDKELIIGEKAKNYLGSIFKANGCDSLIPQELRLVEFQFEDFLVDIRIWCIESVKKIFEVVKLVQKSLKGIDEQIIYLCEADASTDILKKKQINKLIHQKRSEMLNSHDKIVQVLETMTDDLVTFKEIIYAGVMTTINATEDETKGELEISRKLGLNMTVAETKLYQNYNKTQTWLKHNQRVIEDMKLEIQKFETFKNQRIRFLLNQKHELQILDSQIYQENYCEEIRKIENEIEELKQSLLAKRSRLIKLEEYRIIASHLAEVLRRDLLASMSEFNSYTSILDLTKMSLHQVQNSILKVKIALGRFELQLKIFQDAVRDQRENFDDVDHHMKQDFDFLIKNPYIYKANIKTMYDTNLNSGLGMVVLARMYNSLYILVKNLKKYPVELYDPKLGLQGNIEKFEKIIGKLNEDSDIIARLENSKDRNLRQQEEMNKTCKTNNAKCDLELNGPMTEAEMKRKIGLIT